MANCIIILIRNLKHVCPKILHYNYVTVLAKTCIVHTKTEFNFIATVDRCTQYLSIPSVSSVKHNVNWSAFVKGILPTLQTHVWNNGTHGRQQLGSGYLGLFELPLTIYVAQYMIGHCVGIMAAHGVSQTVVFATSYPTHPLYYQC